MNERFAASFAPALSYYAALSPAAGFQGRCAMSIPADIEGKRVLDVCCRKGKVRPGSITFVFRLRFPKAFPRPA